MPKEKTLVILAAGMGSRFGGLKQVAPVGPSGELIIDYSVYDALQSGFSRLIVVIREENESDFRRAIGDRLGRHLPLAYVHQCLDALPDGHALPSGRVKPWGTGHATLAAAEKVHEPFAVINADDFYGRRSFEILARHLDGTEPSGTDYALVGFPLRQTLSAAGSVSRGICSVDEAGWLLTVTERSRILGGAEGISYESAKGCVYPLSGDELVSMNMWGFSPEVFALIGERFAEFLESGRGTGDGEFYLPEAVNDLLKAGRVTVRALSTDESWFGVTYREDLEGTRKAIRDRIGKGLYGEDLWAG